MHRRLAVVALAAVTLVTGPGLLSAVTDTFASERNSFQSGAAPGGGAAVDVRVARVPRPTTADGRTVLDGTVSDCPTSTSAYVEGPVAAMVSGQQVDLSKPIPDGRSAVALHDSRDMLCIKNFGTVPARLDVSGQIVTTRELGACTSRETTAGDTTCGKGAFGELHNVVEAGYGAGTYVDPNAQSECSGQAAALAWGVAQRKSIATGINPGGICIITLALFRVKSTDQALGQADSDRVDFNIVFTATEQPR